MKLRDKQIKKMESRPDMIAQFTNWIADYIQGIEGERPEIYVHVHAPRFSSLSLSLDYRLHTNWLLSLSLSRCRTNARSTSELDSRSSTLRSIWRMSIHTPTNSRYDSCAPEVI